MGLCIYDRELEKVTKEGVITGLVKNKKINNCEYCGAGSCRVRTAQHCWVLTGSRVIIGAKIRFSPLVENKKSTEKPKRTYFPAPPIVALAPTWNKNINQLLED